MGDYRCFSSVTTASCLAVCFLLCALLLRVQAADSQQGTTPASAVATHHIRGLVASDVDTTGRTATFTLAAGETKRIHDGQYALSSANGRVWHDINGNSNDDEQDKQGTALAGVPVHLYLAQNGTRVETALTRADGRFTFKVDPGSYYVYVECPTGFVISRRTPTGNSKINAATKSSDPFAIEASKAITGVDCGCYKPPVISGVVFKDLNMDGIQGPSEAGIPEIEVKLTLGTDSTFSRNTWTDKLGQFKFSDLEPGDYAVHILSPEEFHHSPFTGAVSRERISTQADGKKRVGTKTEALTRSAPKTKPNGMKEVSIYLTLLSGDRAVIDTGLYTLSVVEGVVFEDTNADGVWTDGEKILPNVEVSLFRAPQTLLMKTHSNEVGEYRFPDLVPGEYYVSFDLSSPEYKHSAKKN